ncbi:protein phosphatase 2C domain-containing protein [Actinocrinis puniceicyclus]|uniref:Serine/threonine protein phosphatase PstP n=1 Tax=Actinocrinis puniceicyclus TaxID=977794 RepID=A0A8J7WLU6_9ACTN|nr:protein phosphatase 2C domain-containing protein [Actinocrinis puniceicyclus]MBS2962072.1 protein phosphatase 2C domain-containing protein [Actinocrinis puniceicyclus]
MSLSLRYAARSHVGLIRDGNEDSGYAGPRLLVVADGMGGQAAGELASSVVVQTIAQLDTPALPQPPGDPMRALAERIDEAHERLHTIITENPQLEGMGTTLTTFLFSEQSVAFAHIGDSRAYRVRGGRLEQLTADHTWVQRLVEEGRISEEEAGHHPQRSLLMRALDGRGQVADADILMADVQAGDRLMLCSDGLSSFVSFDTLESTLAGYADPHQAAESLIQLALRAGGPDNVTCIVADVFDPSTGGPGSSANAQTQYIEMPVTVGAAAEHPGGAGLPSFGALPAQAAMPGTNTAGNTDEIPVDTPAGRAARLRRHERREKSADDTEGPQVGDWAPDPKNRRWVKPAVALAAIVVVLGGLGGGAYYWTQQQYYVASDNGHVAIYKGVNASVAGFRLSHVYSTTPQVAVSTLPMASQERVRDTITATSLSDAQSIVNTLSVLGQDCTALTTAPGASLNPSVTASVSPSAVSTRPSASGSTGTRPSASASKQAMVTPPPLMAPSPSPSASIAESNQLSAQCPGASGDSGGGGSS